MIFRESFRFSLRDLLWLTTLVAVGLCWYKDRQRVNDKIALLDSERSLLTEERASLTKDMETITRMLSRFEVNKDTMLAYFRRNWPPGRAIPKGTQTLEDENRDLKVKVSELEQQLEQLKTNKTTGGK